VIAATEGFLILRFGPHEVFVATFYKGFVYETGVSGDLMIEGVVARFAKVSNTESLDDLAQRYIKKVLLRRRNRIRAKHLAILNKGVAVWDRWRRMYPNVRPTLADAKPKDFATTKLQGCDFSYANLCQTRLPENIHLERASFHQAILAGANLSKA